MLWTLLAMAQRNVIDEVIWIVGDEAILRSEVEEQRIRAQYEGTEFKGDPYCEIPEQLAIQKLFLHQGAIDSVEVSESQVASQVEMRMNYILSQIGSKEKMEEYFRKPTPEIREDMRDMVRNQMIIQQVQQGLVSAVKSTSDTLKTALTRPLEVRQQQIRRSIGVRCYNATPARNCLQHRHLPCHLARERTVCV